MPTENFLLMLLELLHPTADDNASLTVMVPMAGNGSWIGIIGGGAFLARAAFLGSGEVAPSAVGPSVSAVGLGASAAFFFVGAFLGAGMADTCFSAVPMVLPSCKPYFL